MARRYTIEDCRQIARERGGECLSEVYLNCETKMSWQCGQGHKWAAVLGSLLNMKTWCLRCSGKYPKSIEDARAIATERGGACLSTSMTSIRDRLLWECSLGHIFETAYSTVFHNGTWCPECGGVKRRTLEDARALGIKMGGECIAEDFFNTQTPISWRCAEGHEWKATFTNVSNSGTWCLKCCGLAPRTLEDARAVAIARGGECLSSEFVNTGTKLEWKCGREHIWTATYRDVHHNDSWCPSCARQISKAETRVFNAISAHYPDAQQGVRRLLKQKKFQLDTWIPSMRVGIEFDGVYWHSRPGKKEMDARKDAQCIDAGIHLIRIPEEIFVADEAGVVESLLATLSELSNTRRAA